MICSIDGEQCAGGIRFIDVLPWLGLAALILVAAATAYQFRELIGGLLVLLIGSAILWSFGLHQVLFIISFIPAITFTTMIPADDNWKGWRHWHPGIWLAAPCFIAAISMAIWAHEETKTLATVTNLLGTALLVWGWLSYMSRPQGADKAPGME